jgi:D-sedoheptulose 7-phosphate isomerase
MNQTAEFERRAAKLIEASIAVKQSVLRDTNLISSIARVSEILLSALKRGNKLLLFGNGGSAADAQHIAAEFVGRLCLIVPRCRPWPFR